MQELWQLGAMSVYFDGAENDGGDNNSNNDDSDGSDDDDDDDKKSADPLYKLLFG